MEAGVRSKNMITIGSGEHREKLFLYVPTRSSKVVSASVRAVLSQWPHIAILSVNLQYSPCYHHM